MSVSGLSMEPFPLPPLPSFLLPSTDPISVMGAWNGGSWLHGLQGFASHRGGILSRGWLATVEAPGCARHPPST